ncbi:amidohydrolase family protein [Pedobacter faecalis]|uniref:amidohydrolase family protein n=1 Tax=Pedobacter faecalis TaxID=3041495 RepID=UPI00254E6B9E|nr:amidohydrolase family protein [Pedobacter sp. ELA7]
MVKIDAHQHFWIYDNEQHSWIGDDMAVLKRDFLPEQLAPVLKACDIAGCVAVQADQTAEETDFLLKLADQHSFIKGVVGWVDLQADDIADQLPELKLHPKLKGFRHILQSETDRAFMLRPAFATGIAALGKHDFTFDILIYADQLGYAAELVRKFPGQRFVLNHIGKPSIKDAGIRVWEKDLRQLALCENVYCKVSGLITEAEWSDWTFSDLVPYLDVVFNAFGAQRLMFGSDWPVSLLAGNYGQVVDVLETYLRDFSTLERESVWAANATRFYNLSL